MKYFVVSDIHSFYDELQLALKQAGYDKKNKEHTLIVCGDVFDRGPKTMEVYKFLKSIPKKRCILIRGNHELLFNELLEKTFAPDSYDFSNGTVRTFSHIAKAFGIMPKDYDDRWLDPKYWMHVDYAEHDGKHTGMYKNKANEYWTYTREDVENSEVYQWLNSKQWVNYYELGKYIFVHSFIPTKDAVVEGMTEGEKALLRYYGSAQLSEYDPDWRKASDAAWHEAMWGCPWRQYRYGYSKGEIDKGNCIVCGHWHASAFHEVFEHIYENNNVYFSEYLIALDGCTAASHQVNVMVIDEDMKCYQYGKELKEIPLIETVTLEQESN